MHRSWQRFDALQREWQAKEREIMARNEQLETDAALVNTALAETARLREEAKTAKKASAEAVKETKAMKEELRTCQLDRDYHKEVVITKTTLARDLQKIFTLQLLSASNYPQR